MCKQMSGKGDQSKSWSMSEPSISGKGKGKENQGETKGLSKGTKSENKSAKVSCEGKMLETGQVDKKTTTCIHEKWNLDERNDGWSFDGLNDDRNCVEWREDCDQTQVTSAGSFSLESSGWQKMSMDTRVAADTLPSNFDREGIGDRSFYDWIPDGEAWNFQGYDENGSPRALDGRLLDAYKVLNSIASASSSRFQEAQLTGVPKILDSAACDLCCEEQQDICENTMVVT